MISKSVRSIGRALAEAYRESRSNAEMRRSAVHLARHDRLHLGAGPILFENWANIDISRDARIVYWDLTIPLRLRPNSIRFVYSEHFIEHITRAQAVTLLRSCWKGMVTGGVIRISTPDLERLAAEYTAKRTSEWIDMGWAPASPCQMLNEGLRLWGHQFVYDESEMAAVLTEAGFARVKRRGWRQSDHPELVGLESRPFHGDLIVEATRP
jgi:predicted SAM-dependent methyltransferase